MSNEAATFTMTLAGREITFRRAGIGQVIMLQRRAFKKIKAADGLEEDQERVDMTTTALVEVFDFIDTLIVGEDDRQFVEDQMLAGAIGWEEIVRVLAGGAPEPAADDEVPRKKVPRKSPKAAPVDLSDKKPATIVAKPAKAAARGRAKR